MIEIVEVGPRDGLQNERTPIPLPVKLRLIHHLVEAGLTEIEATSFVSPKWVPQLADAAELWPQLPTGPSFSALVPNARGLETALSLGVNRIALFTAASDEFTRKNINQSVEESLESFAQLANTFREAQPNGWIRGYVSTAFECPYAGRIDPHRVVGVANRLVKEVQVDEISFGDTIGVASPKEVKTLIHHLMNDFAGELSKVAWHFHDTRGTAIANVAEVLESGHFHRLDSSAGGLGGCPYAPGAGGNLATEDLVYFLNREGLECSVDPDHLAQASLEILDLLGRQPASRAQQASLALCARAEPR